MVIMNNKNNLKPIVLVTGFGPFKNHPVNNSWEAVKLMNKEELEQKLNIELIRLELPVTYENVDKYVPDLWRKHSPELVIHVGVSSLATCLTLETQAHRLGYTRLDCVDKCPAEQTCAAEGDVRICTKLDVDKICQEFNEDCPPETSVVSSRDAGRFLCEYIYYTSLSTDAARTLFVHVPDARQCPAPRAAHALERVLELALKQRGGTTRV